MICKVTFTNGSVKYMINSVKLAYSISLMSAIYPEITPVKAEMVNSLPDDACSLDENSNLVKSFKKEIKCHNYSK